MGGFPIQTIVMVIAMLGFAAYYMLVMRKRQVANLDQQHANFRASELAKRLGLRLVSGDPNFNLFIFQAAAQVLSGPTDDKPIDIDVKMQGSPGGVNLELVYLFKVTQKTDKSYLTNQIKIERETWFDCRMIAHTAQPFPPFEVVSRTTAMGQIQQTMAVAPIVTGNPTVDSVYLVATQEPGMAQLLGQLLPAFAQFNQNGVHLVGDGQTISFVMKRDKPPLVANALYFAETLAANLTEMARRIGG